MHWLSGSAPQEKLNSLWRHVGALNDNVAIHYPEPFIEYDDNGTPVRFYRNVDATEQHMLALSPADAKEIRRLCNHIRKVKNLAIPITNLRGLKTTKKNRLPLSLLSSALSALLLIRSFSKISREQYLSRFHHAGIREMLRACTSESNGVLPLFFTMGTLARGDGGFPEGGSLPFVQRMAKTFASLGGQLLLNTRAERVLVKNGQATGVMAGDKQLDTNAVIVASDTMAMEHLFDIPPQAAWLEEMRAKTQPTMATLVCLGMGVSLKKYNNYIIFKLKTPIKLAEQTYEYLRANNYAADAVYSPKGKTAMTFQLGGDTYAFWKKAKEEGRYEEEKQKIAHEVVAALTTHIPEVEGRVEVSNVATPLTYERYCANWKGSWMTEMTPGMKMKSYPAVIKGLEGVYFAGHRMVPPGGLPIALLSGRTAVQYLCRDRGTLFVCEE